MDYALKAQTRPVPSLGGLVISGGLQGWWIAPVLASLTEEPPRFAAAALTALNDNALIAYLVTLVPDLDDPLKVSPSSKPP